jgi:hypothetical protein
MKFEGNYMWPPEYWRDNHEKKIPHMGIGKYD